MAVLALGALVPRAGGETIVEVKRKCQICDAAYTTSVPGSFTTTGQRLDTRLLGAVSSPPRIGTCPKCGFVDFRRGKSFTEAELKTLRAFVTSTEYAALMSEQSDYGRAARLLEEIGGPTTQIAFSHLYAAWRAEDAQRRPQELEHLKASLAAMEKAIAEKSTDAGVRTNLKLLKGELLRRLGRFDEARAHFKELRKDDAVMALPCADSVLIAQMQWIDAGDAAPHTMPATPPPPPPARDEAAPPAQRGSADQRP